MFPEHWKKSLLFPRFNLRPIFKNNLWYGQYRCIKFSAEQLSHPRSPEPPWLLVPEHEYWRPTSETTSSALPFFTFPKFAILSVQSLPQGFCKEVSFPISLPRPLPALSSLSIKNNKLFQERRYPYLRWLSPFTPPSRVFLPKCH